MTGKPPHRGGPGRSRTGPGGRSFAPVGRRDDGRARTGPRNTARDAAERAAAGRDLGDAAPWEQGAPPAPRPPAGRPAGAKSGGAKPQSAKSAGTKPTRDKPAGLKPAGPRPPRESAAPRPRAAPNPAAPRPEGAPTRREVRAATAAALATGVQTLEVTPDEAGMRIDRFLAARFPQLPFTRIQSLVRKGELRVDGKRAKAADRVEPGASVRVPPLKLDQPRPTGPSPARAESDLAFLRSLILYEDRDMMVLNKPFGLAVQGGSGTTRHVDGLLEAMRDGDGQKPRLVHRLDKDTAGCLIVAKTRLAAATLAKTFRSRAARKIYWALAAGVPRVRQGRVSTYLAKEEVGEADARMRVAQHGDEGASHALTYYATVDQAGQKLAWLSLKPVTGRTHQLRAHAAHIGHPLVGDPKYFDIENWELPGGIQNRLHLLARRIVIPHPRTGQPVDVTAPLPPHMAQSWNLLGFDASRYDPIVEAPEN
ncbi:RluA family pseudouridine synthase [Methylobacterium oryzihabitans]|uniref:Ribosomal large subunit pseudouridine synthase D n=1 Tax=Methylobacterium oryzihabitans TaxID=2499852 RepID=A0A437PHD0_9HYPH|nr:RluA family pseudouridine synthase [Methylobacterium oryzihabitans]RVU21672.1 RluA family pseudouridine synthase [Methylobacterium oryzihabitans]